MMVFMKAAGTAKDQSADGGESFGEIENA